MVLGLGAVGCWKKSTIAPSAAGPESSNARNKDPDIYVGSGAPESKGGKAGQKGAQKEGSYGGGSELNIRAVAWVNTATHELVDETAQSTMRWSVSDESNGAITALEDHEVDVCGPDGDQHCRLAVLLVATPDHSEVRTIGAFEIPEDRDEIRLSDFPGPVTDLVPSDWSGKVILEYGLR
jgi:hypothetical protein